MILGCITYHDVGTLCRVNGSISSEKRIDILDNNLWLLVARHFPDNYVWMIMNPFIGLIFPQLTKINNIHCWSGSAVTRFKPHRKCLVSNKMKTRVNKIKPFDELYEKILDILASFSVAYAKRKICMHPFQQECAEFDRTAGTSQNIKITPCFLYFINFYKSIRYFLQF